MPELPEVEVSRRGIEPGLVGHTIAAIVVRDARLRWPVPDSLQQAVGQQVLAVRRRAKYLLITLANGDILLHLGMSGKLRVIPQQTPLIKHDHIDIVLTNGHCLRFNDPRRFGACLWQPTGTALIHLQHLGPEPLTDAFDGQHLYRCARGRKSPVKQLIMDNKVVVGVGNIYASESLFLAGISPLRQAGRISLRRYQLLATTIKDVLARAITAGGTTLRDFAQADGNPGYFQQHLFVYGRAAAACERCHTPIKSEFIGQRNSFYCPKCQS